VRLSHNHKQFSTFIWSKLLPQVLSGKIATFLQKRTENRLKHQEKGFTATKITLQVCYYAN